MLRLKIFRRTMKFFDIGANLTDPVFKVRLNSKKFQDLSFGSKLLFIIHYDIFRVYIVAAKSTDPILMIS